MKNDTTNPLQTAESSAKDVLAAILRDGAREMLSKAIEVLCKELRGDLGLGDDQSV